MTRASICPECGHAIPADAPAGCCPRCLVASTASTKAPGPTRLVGEYELVERLAAGATSVVYRARHLRLNKPVAVKMVRAGLFATETEQRRLRLEAEAAATLDHPHIVPVSEVGETEGWSYLVMPLIEGGSLAERLSRAGSDGFRDSSLPAPAPFDACQSACLMAKVARAVYHAHQHGILHRDLKPGNILLDAAGEPHLTDFGLAKWLERDSGTLSGAVLGTPHYMSPEQAAGRTRDATVASDVFSLGAILYHLLCGQPPFQGGNNADILHAVLHVEPHPLRALDPKVDRDLETICLKCLQKEPERRYTSAEALADDLKRWLDHEPILARPVGRLEKVRVWARHNPAVATLSALLILALMGGLALTTWQLFRAERFLAGSRAANLRLAESAARRGQREVELLFGGAKVQEAIMALAQLVRENPSNRLASARLFAVITERKLPWPVLPPLLHGAEVRQGEFTRDNRFILTASADGWLSVWNRTNGTRQFSFPHDAARGRFAVSPNGTCLATLGSNGFAQVWQLPEGKLLFESDATHSSRREEAQTTSDFGLWIADLSSSLSTSAAPAARVAAAEFSPDNSLLATASLNGHAALWRVSDGQWLGAVDHGEPLHRVLFHPRGQTLLTIGTNTCQLWPILTNNHAASAEVSPFTFHASRFTAHPLAAPVHAEFSPKGDKFLTVSTNAIELWETATGARLECFRWNATVNFASFSPDGQLVASANAAERAHVQWAAGGKAFSRSIRHDLSVNTARGDPTGKWLATTSDDGQTQVTSLTGLHAEYEPCLHRRAVFDAVFSPVNGRQLLTISADRTARLWALNRMTGAEAKLGMDASPLDCEFSPDGQTIAEMRSNQTVRLFAVDSKPRGGPARHSHPVTGVSFSPDSQWLASGDTGGHVLVSTVQTSAVPQLTLRHDAAVHRLAWSRDSRTLAVATASNVCVWQITASPGSAGVSPAGPRASQAGETPAIQSTGNILLENSPSVRLPISGVGSLDFSPDGRLLALAARDAAAVFDARTGRKVTPDLSHPGPIAQVRFSPDGRRLATGGDGNAARIWDAGTGAPVTPWVRPGDDVTCVAFSPDSATLLTASHDGLVALWDARSGRLRHAVLRHRSAVLTAEFSPDGQWVASSGMDRAIRLFHAEFALPACDGLRGGVQPRVRFSSDGRLLLFTAPEATAHLVKVPSAFMPSPDLLLTLAEFVVGQRLNELGGWEDLTTEEWWARQRQIRQRWNSMGPLPQRFEYR
ncbi:MAG: protein kinase [Verrucomicrobia bacterium]|nr:protein kinase [Verrucomicrobiota bacterium]